MPAVALAADWAAPTLCNVGTIRLRAATSNRDSQPGKRQGRVDGH